LTLGLLLGIAGANTRALDPAFRELSTVDWGGLVKSVLVTRLTSFHTWFWGSLGLVSALRLGSRRA
jgi:hypothetical protein